MRPLNKMPGIKYSITRLGGGLTKDGVSYPGGLDLTTPSLALQPGACRSSQNYECSQSGGYSRLAGYERFDGHASPSAAIYTIVQFSSFTNIPVVGDTFTQAVSGATGKVVVVSIIGTFYAALTQVTGTFDTTHLVSTGVAIGIPVTTTVSLSALTQAQYLNLAADVYRALIAAVPGSGSVLDVFGMNFSGTDAVYAFRANVGGTAVDLYKSTSSGWSQITFLNTVGFSAGSVLPLEGDTLTQGGVTAIIKRVMWASGTTGAVTAAGTLVITNPTGGNFAAGAATSSSGGVFNLTGIQVAIVMLPGGHFEHEKANFSGQGSSIRVYGCDGVNKAWEFDGTILAPITSGLSPDAPSHITSHKNYLVLSRASSIIGSGPGLPYKWTTTDGAWEFATGDVVTGLLSLPGQQTTAILAVFQKANTSFLYGFSPADFNLVSFNTGIGAFAYSAQNLFDPFVFDDLGIITLQTTLNYGNFLPSTLTRNIYPLIAQQRSKITASTIQREKSQYRIFFNDGTGLYLTFVNRQYLGIMPITFPNVVKCIDHADRSDGMVTYFGSTNGFVYQEGVGTSFDGTAISAFITLAWDSINSPRVLKRFRALSLEVQGNAYAAINIGYQFGYGSSAVGQPNTLNVTTGFVSAPSWDSFIWDSFIWDGQTLLPTDIDLTGTAENVQVTISSETDYIAPYTINSVIYHYTPRRGLRV